MGERNEKALAFLRDLDIKTSIGGFEKKATIEGLRSLSDIYEEVLSEERSASIKKQNDAEQRVEGLEDALHNCQLELAEAKKSLATVKSEAGLKAMKEEKKNIIRELNLIQTQLNDLIAAAKFPKDAI